MALEDGLFSHLTTDVGVSALVGTRVYPEWRPQSTELPAVTYQRISGERIQTLTGPTQLSHTRVQVMAFAEDYNGVKALVDAIKVALDGVSGSLGGTTIQQAWLDGSPTDLGEIEGDNVVRQVSMDFIVVLQE